MQMNIDLSVLKSNFLVKEDATGKLGLTHRPNELYKLFPYTTKKDQIVSLSNVSGGFLRSICNQKASSKLDNSLDEFNVIMGEVCAKLEFNNSSDKAFFQNIVENLFFDNEKNMIPLNLTMLKHIRCDTNEEKMAQFLCDVLMEQADFSDMIREIEQTYDANVLERYFVKNLPSLADKKSDDNFYQSIVTGLQDVFLEDMEYILGDNEMTKSYLTDLLELYYFYYVSQTCCKLNNFFSGNRNPSAKLYYSLDWEKTSKSRDCYQYGWKWFQEELNNMFVHAIVLEMLNQNNIQERYDYLAIKEDLRLNPEKDSHYAAQVKQVSEIYIKCFSGLTKTLEAIERTTKFEFETETEIYHLFDCVRMQFEYNDKRRDANRNYIKHFQKFCEVKKLKNRKSAGLMLNLTERELIFLTKLSLKKCEKMRLVDVFFEFERRGICLDNISKNVVMQYYEKLNLIEKKSDSGDAQYVKGIL